jgi:hypothetical protein
VNDNFESATDDSVDLFDSKRAATTDALALKSVKETIKDEKNKSGNERFLISMAQNIDVGLPFIQNTNVESNRLTTMQCRQYNI